MAQLRNGCRAGFSWARDGAFKQPGAFSFINTMLVVMALPSRQASSSTATSTK